jgi:hypothetical protein
MIARPAPNVRDLATHGMPALLAIMALAYLFGWRPREGWPDPLRAAAT